MPPSEDQKQNNSTSTDTQEKAGVERGFAPKMENWPFWVGIILIAVGLTLSFIIPTVSLTLPIKLMVAGITELGFAFFIAHIIIITIDKREKDHFLNLVQKNRDDLEDAKLVAERRLNSKIYLSHILDVELPKSISDELSEYIVASRLVKKEQNIDYCIEELGSHTRLVQTLDATFENAHQDDHVFSPTFRSYHSENPEIEAEYPDVNWGIKSFMLSVQDPKTGNMNEVDLKPKHVDGKPILDKPIVMKFGERVRNRVEFITPKYAADNEVFTNVQFAETLNVNVRYDKAVYEVGYRCIHARSDCMQITEGETMDNLSFRHPFLPSNGVIVWWRKKNK